MTDEQFAVAMLTGFLSMLAYVEGIRPILKKLIQEAKPRLKRWVVSFGIFSEYQSYLDGYGWAWAAVMVDDCTLEEVYIKTDTPFKQSTSAAHFDQGAIRALQDIEHFQDLKKERT